MRNNKRQYPRTARLNEVVLEVLAVEVHKLSDPRLGLVTLTGVEVSPDLHHATVYYSVIKDTQGLTHAALRSAAPRLQQILGQRTRMKYLPKLQFEVDSSIAEGERIDSIIKSLYENSDED